jgi:hypothetical protein
MPGDPLLRTDRICLSDLLGVGAAAHIISGALQQNGPADYIQNSQTRNPIDNRRVHWAIDKLFPVKKNSRLIVN